jgi:tRNA dimethylallyltransferase
MDARAVRIFDQGLVDEVRGLLAAGVPRGSKPFESLGYKQALEVIEGRLTREQALAATQLETRRYAKRQLTWFRKEHGVRWLSGFGHEPAVQQKALALLATEF